MKTIRTYGLLVTTLVCVLSFNNAVAQQDVEMADTMRSEGKIYVIVGIILIVLAGLFTYLFMLDRKIRKMEEKP